VQLNEQLGEDPAVPATIDPPGGGRSVARTVAGGAGGVPEVEREIVRDIVRRGLPVAPLVVLVAGLARGTEGAWSAAYAVAIVLVNLALAAASLGWAARTSLNLLMATALGGFLVRMGLVTVAILVVRHDSWVDLPTLAVTVLGTQLGLLAWEARHVSATLAYPGLKPPKGGA